LGSEVKDDGTGMDHAAPSNGYEGNGMRNMRERAREINAVRNLHTAPGKGTRLLLKMPRR